MSMDKIIKKVRDRAFDNMARAIARYIKGICGSAAVGGVVKIGKEPNSLKYNYFIQVGITGKLPPEAEKKLNITQPHRK